MMKWHKEFVVFSTCGAISVSDSGTYVTLQALYKTDLNHKEISLYCQRREKKQKERNPILLQ